MVHKNAKNETIDRSSRFSFSMDCTPYKFEDYCKTTKFHRFFNPSFQDFQSGKTFLFVIGLAPFITSALCLPQQKPINSMQGNPFLHII